MIKLINQLLSKEKRRHAMLHEAIYRFDIAAVRFAIYPDGDDGPRILADISEDALRCLYGVSGGADSLLEAFSSNFVFIESEAIRRYKAAPSKPIRLESSDFAHRDLYARSTPP